MSVQAIHTQQVAAQAEAVSQAQSAQKQAKTTQSSAVPEDKVTISAAAQGKQTAASIGGDPDHDGK
jgi:hypothetical protein